MSANNHNIPSQFLDMIDEMLDIYRPELDDTPELLIDTRQVLVNALQPAYATADKLDIQNQVAWIGLSELARKYSNSNRQLQEMVTVTAISLSQHIMQQDPELNLQGTNSEIDTPLTAYVGSENYHG